MITLEEFKKNQSDKCRLIGLDLGSKRIGVSICDEKQLIATPFKTINRSTSKELIDELKSIIEENNIKGIIIGNPINMDGSKGRSAQSVEDTSNNIEKNIDIPICLWDERLSTVGAFNLSSQLDINVSKREKKIDENAAAFILQGAIDFLNN
jgi:putative Holliday junction resolvase